jgi:hypothetical protein
VDFTYWFRNEYQPATSLPAPGIDDIGDEHMPCRRMRWGVGQGLIGVTPERLASPYRFAATVFAMTRATAHERLI